ncbi:MAG: TIGR04283 family arsenosugar biosynthesis glycosyltransferase [Thermodesulfobacteriota bacterium]|nr:TIGR04283 family arsenosugar biosynthesis glycosyltransferase [Thermodesulfobacteriota bacterium]
MIISIIIPVLNEATLIADTLLSLQPLRAAGHELIVVDGGSTDASVILSQPLADQVIRSPRGRSQQMNGGAKSANGEILLFLHADTFLPNGADRMINQGMNGKKKVWGRFDVKLAGKHPLLRIVELLMSLRSRLSGIATGDQGIFVRRELFEMVGGFPDIDLMEDIALSKILKKVDRPLCLWQRVLTSSRRWEKKGILRTVLLMWFLRLAYFYKVEPRRLIKLYYPLG